MAFVKNGKPGLSHCSVIGKKMLFGEKEKGKKKTRNGNLQNPLAATLWGQ